MSLSASPDDAGAWSELFGLSGCDGIIQAIAHRPDDTLYVGGNFQRCDGVVVNHIAQWDGTAWSSLGDGTDNAVTSLLIGPDGDLYAGGWFFNLGSNVARWDGQQWHPIGTGLSGSGATFVTSLAFSPDGILHAGGEFTESWGQVGPVVVNRIARFDGDEWQALGEGVDASIRAIAFDDQGQLLVGGEFNHAGGQPIIGLARWDGTEWHAVLSPDTPAGVSSMVRSVDGTIHVAGPEAIEGFSRSHVSLWNGGKLTPVGEVFGDIRALALDGAGRVLALGDLSWPAANLARWDGESWTVLLSHQWRSWRFYALSVDARDAIVIGGDFDRIDDVAVAGLAVSDNDSWLTPTSIIMDTHGLTGEVRATAVDADGRIFAAGRFRAIGGEPVDAIAEWTATGWQAIGSALTSADSYEASVHALAFDTHGHLYAGGSFNRAGNQPVANIVRWDGGQWQPVGDGLTGGSVFALAVDRASGDLFAAGNFVGTVAQWTGEDWTLLSSEWPRTVYALAAHPEGGIYAGGSFTSLGGTSASRVAYWDGLGWLPLATGLGSLEVNALVARADGSLIVGGLFQTAGGIPARNIARWDGKQWFAMGDGFSSTVYALTEDTQGRLYAGGRFHPTSSNPERLARWTGDRWIGVGGGVRSGQVNAIAANPTGTLILGGTFNEVGAIESQRVAMFEPTRLFANGFEAH